MSATDAPNEDIQRAASSLVSAELFEETCRNDLAYVMPTEFSYAGGKPTDNHEEETATESLTGTSP